MSSHSAALIYNDKEGKITETDALLMQEGFE